MSTVITCAQLASLALTTRIGAGQPVRAFLEVSRRYLAAAAATREPAPPPAARRGLVSSRIRSGWLQPE
jgi:hypothetical protein